MNKRTFIKLFAAALASAPVMRLLAWAGQKTLRNWAGNIEYSTNLVQTSSSLAQVQKYVKTRPKLKVLGTRHCFNNIADSKDRFLSLKPMDEVISLDPTKRTVTVAARASRMDSCAPISTARALPFTTWPRCLISPWQAHAAQRPMDQARKTAIWLQQPLDWK
jgi:hypothetical protein